VNSPHPSLVPTLIFVPLIGLLLYGRLRRTFGRQAVAPARMGFRMILLSVISVLFVISLPTAAGFGAALAGLVAGVALARVGLAHTKFEVTDEGKFYVPNKWLGLLVTALVLGRVAARLFTLSEQTAKVAAGAPPFAGLQRSPLTLGLFLLLAGYYVTYYAGVLRTAARLAPAPEASPLP
jgi:hypothetical protein